MHCSKTRGSKRVSDVVLVQVSIAMTPLTGPSGRHDLSIEGIKLVLRPSGRQKET
jgi:hypothetical protein